MHCGVEVTESSTNKQHHLYISPPLSSPLRPPIRPKGFVFIKPLVLTSHTARPSTHPIPPPVTLRDAKTGIKDRYEPGV